VQGFAEANEKGLVQQGQVQLKGIEMPSELATASTKPKLIFVGPGMFPGLFISNEPNSHTG
jgi:hypothetical protein